MKAIKSLYVLILSISCGNCLNLNDVMLRFDQDPCIEDNFSEQEITKFLQPGSWDIISGVPDIEDEFPIKNSLSTMNELAQYNDIEYYFYLESHEGKPHDNVFSILLKLGKEVYKGTGKSIKEAKYNASNEALLYTNYDIPEKKEKNEHVILTPTVELNNLAMKLGMKVVYLSEDELIDESLIYKQKNISIPNGKWKTREERLNYTIYHPYERKVTIPKENKHGRPFKVGVIVGTLKFIGIGYTLQSARHDAASKAIAALRQLLPEDIDQCKADGVICNPNNVKSPISLLYETAQKKNICLDFQIIGENGPAHEKEFITKCQYGDITIEGTGRSKKASKKIAAENMLEKLKHTEPSSNLKFSDSDFNNKKKKKKKVIKSSLEKFGKGAKSFLDSAWEYFVPQNHKSDTDNKLDGKRKKTKHSNNNDATKDFKRSLLGITQERAITIQFVDIGSEQSEFYSLLFLGMQPKHVCLGDGASYHLSREKASMEALNFLSKLGIEDLIPCEEAFSYIKATDFGKIEVIDNAMTEEDSKKE